MPMKTPNFRLLYKFEMNGFNFSRTMFVIHCSRQYRTNVMKLANVNTTNGQNYILVTENYDDYRQIMFEFCKVLKHQTLWVRP